MKIIQSFWTKPSLHQSEDSNARFNGGWMHRKYAFYSYALSALTLRKHYDDLELYTDDYGVELFGSVLQLPYTKIHNTLNELDSYDTKLWAIGKLVACAKQTEPFLHIDNDIFLWDKIHYDSDRFDLVAQNIEADYPNYGDAFRFVRENFSHIPEELVTTYQRNGGILTYNAGVIGGKKVDFFKELESKAFAFIDQNKDRFGALDLGIFNLIFEQQLGYALAENRNLNVQYLFNKVAPNFAQVVDFAAVPVYSQYIHCIGFAKRSVYATEQVEARLLYHFPNEYHALNKRLNAYFNTDEFTSNPIPESRQRHIFAHYRAMEQATFSDLLAQPMRLADHVSLATDTSGNPTLEFTIPQIGERETKGLEGWSSLLLYFEETASVAELHEALSEDQTFMNGLEHPEELRQNLLSFVLEKTLMLELLERESNTSLSA